MCACSSNALPLHPAGQEFVLDGGVGKKMVYPDEAAAAEAQAAAVAAATAEAAAAAAAAAKQAQQQPAAAEADMSVLGQNIEAERC